LLSENRLRGNIDSIAALAPRIADGSLFLPLPAEFNWQDGNDCLTATDAALIAALDLQWAGWDRCNNP